MTVDLANNQNIQQLNVNRLVYNQELLNQAVEYQKPKASCK